ncbi:MAG: hypothetical protein SGI92_32695 [Bryobacteraceae bacterium]|nr:hypothetical protein [Bryobacteraceae bacterium]
MANAQHENNDTYRLYSGRPGAVTVVNQDGFVMAEYDQSTGATAWLRVVAATKRESVEQRLAQQFPAVVETTVAAPRSRAKNPKP